MFRIITHELQAAFENYMLYSGVDFRDCGVPCICGYYGRACRQMDDTDAVNRVLCNQCKLSSFLTV